MWWPHCRQRLNLERTINVNTLNVRVGGQRLQLRERTAEKIFPSDEVSAVFGNNEASGLIQAPIEQVDLSLRNVDRWERAGVP